MTFAWPWSQSSADDPIDLSGNLAATTALLADPLAWRVRSVDELVLDGATNCQRSRSLQVRPLAPVLEAAGVELGTSKTAIVALNVAAMPRGPLREFAVEGPSGDAYLLPRLDIAERQAHFLHTVATEIGIQTSADLLSFLEAALGYTPGDAGPLIERRRFAEYLADGVGQIVDPSTVSDWLAMGERCRTILHGRAEKPLVPAATHEPLLAVPELVNSGRIQLREATRVLSSYVQFLSDAASRSRPHDPTSADDLLNALADYGSHYDLIVVVEVPLQLPFIMKYSEQRAMNYSFWRNTGTQTVVIADCATNHVAIAVKDPSVRIKTIEAREVVRGDLAFGAFTAFQSAQAVSLYAFSQDRDYRVTLSISLRVLSRLQFVHYVVGAILAALAVALAKEGSEELRELLVVAGPAALAASILLVRDPSSLTARLRLKSSLTVAAGLFSLIATVVALYLGVDVASVTSDVSKLVRDGVVWAVQRAWDAVCAINAGWSGGM